MPEKLYGAIYFTNPPQHKFVKSTFPTAVQMISWLTCYWSSNPFYGIKLNTCLCYFLAGGGGGSRFSVLNAKLLFKFKHLQVYSAFFDDAKQDSGDFSQCDESQKQ